MFTVNKPLSLMLYNGNREMFKKKECYQNVFKIITEIKEDFKPEKDLQIMFCYAHNGDFYYRHSFCVFKSEIIEPLANVRESLDVARIIPISIMSPKDYFDRICKDQKYDLYMSLYHDEIKVLNENKELMKDLNPIDMCNLVSHIAKTAGDVLRILNDIISGRGIPENA